MSDFLLNLSSNPQAKNLIKRLGLPIPMPEQLRRPRGPVVERPLGDADIVVYSTAKSKVGPFLAEVLAEAGANSHLLAPRGAEKFFDKPGEAYGRPARVLNLDDEKGPDIRPRALVFDATTITDPSGLKELFNFFHPIVRALSKNGRIVVIGRPPESQKSSLAAASQGGLSGFVRSAAKEIGKKGSTAALIYVEEGAESRLAGPLRFLLSPRSTYVTGQPITVSNAVKGGEETPYTNSLDGKTALVTGAARGIGAATAKILAEEGATVVCLDLPRDDGPTSKLARSIGGGVLLADLTDANAPTLIADRLHHEWGGVDIVVHNAGITRDKMLRNMSPGYWDQTLGVNLEAVTRLTATLLDGVLKDNGRLICLSSIAGIAGNPGQTNYATAKSGIVSYVHHLSGQVSKRGITVNAVAPGFIETRLTAAMPVALREVARRMNSLGQGGLPQDIGHAITFFARPHSVGLTGQVLRVCGQSLVGA